MSAGDDFVHIDKEGMSEKKYTNLACCTSLEVPQPNGPTNSSSPVLSSRAQVDLKVLEQIIEKMPSYQAKRRDEILKSIECLSKEDKLEFEKLLKKEVLKKSIQFEKHKETNRWAWWGKYACGCFEDHWGNPLYCLLPKDRTTISFGNPRQASCASDLLKINISSLSEWAYSYYGYCIAWKKPSLWLPPMLNFEEVVEELEAMEELFEEVLKKNGLELPTK